jgi:hypothetical protein
MPGPPAGGAERGAASAPTEKPEAVERRATADAEVKLAEVGPEMRM